MSQEVVVRLRDDYDQSIGGTVATREFSFDGVEYEAELSDSNHALMRADLQKWINVARKRAKPRRRNRVKSDAQKNGEGRTRKPSEWSLEIRGWALQRGYDWDNKEVRQDIRIWSERTLRRPCRKGIIPRDVMEAHYQHRLQHKGFKAE